VTGSQASIRIGTRDSALALWQAERVASAIRALPGAPKTELVLIRTEGDRIQDVPLWKVEGQSFFTKEIERALLDERVDVAVHSLKDLATVMPEGLSLGAVMERGDPRDVLVYREADSDFSLDDLPPGACVGTSSLRRRALLKRWRDDLELAELRGNVPTRLERLEAGAYDAIVLAAAGVKRLGLSERISAYLPLDIFLPAVSQGAVGVQVREGDTRTVEWMLGLDHRDTRTATASEREFLRTVEGGCHVPVGALAEMEGRMLRLRGVVSSLDGRKSVAGELRGGATEAVTLGRSLAEDLLEAGGEEILNEIRREESRG
jgi:hydroxymethylbilane synthase